MCECEYLYPERCAKFRSPCRWRIDPEKFCVSIVLLNVLLLLAVVKGQGSMRATEGEGRCGDPH